MNLPCKHTKEQLPEKGKPYEKNACRVCWLFVNDERFLHIVEPRKLPSKEELKKGMRTCCGRKND